METDNLLGCIAIQSYNEQDIPRLRKRMPRTPRQCRWQTRHNC